MREMQTRPKIIAVVGPTAVGKSALAVKLARRFNGEIISSDSRQVYKGLDIGTGKITVREMRGVPHHLLDVANPRQQFSVAQFQKLARQKIVEILSRGKLPIVCGGTGLYIDSLLNDTSFPEVPPNPKLRKQLEKKTVVELFRLLQRLDPRRAKTIDRHNPRRLVRAIEIAQTLGKIQECADGRGCKKTRINADKIRPPYTTLWIGLTLSSKELKRNIGMRLFARLQPKRSYGGQARIRKYKMIQEVQLLHMSGLSWKRMEALGLEYRYLSRYLRGLLTKEEMTEKLKTEIYRYAKRQMTWFKRNKKIRWFAPTEVRKIEKEVRGFLRV